MLGPADEAAPSIVEMSLWFHVTPAAFLGAGRVSGVELRSTDNATAVDVRLPCELAVTCVGYACKPMARVPVYTDAGAVSKRMGQVLDAASHEVSGLFLWPGGRNEARRASSAPTGRTAARPRSRSSNAGLNC